MIKTISIDSVQLYAEAYYAGGKATKKWSFVGTISGAVSMESKVGLG